MIKSFIVYTTRYIVAALPGSVFRCLRVRIWRTVGFQLDKTVNIYLRAVLDSGKIIVGKNTFIGNDVLITGGTISIGKNCDIVPQCIIHAGFHNIGNHERRAGKSYAGEIIIGDGTWIGTGAIVLLGAYIGKGCVVAGGTVVKAVIYPDNSLLAGCPAIIKKFLED
ncbi:MAG: acyltransferase [Planctomycetaceae bacterium]|jgi:acetyltransferase-like isoleucine patch superfamily enzyme|nr:acyltransferase [Planctomycetaceae bacterium]